MTEFPSYAQNFEDVMLWRALQHVSVGFYVDVGAQHPVADSVSRAFYERGWRGIHVEPSPQYAELLRADRPEETVIEAAVADRAGVLTLYQIANTGLSTADPGIAAQHAREFGVRETSVACMTLDSVLDLCRDREVHWLKIDVEGLERQVIEGWKASAPLPWIVLVESTAPATQRDTSMEWEPLLLARGYRFAYFDGLNRFYVSGEHAELSAAFKAPPNVFDRFILTGTASSTFAAYLNSQIAGLRGRISELETAQEGLRSDLGARIDELRLAQEARERLQRDITASLAQVSQLTEALEAQRGVNADLSAQRDSIMQDRDETRQQAAHLRQQLDHVDAAYRSVVQSRSWRMTRPLREAFGALRRLRDAKADDWHAPAALPRRAAKGTLLAALAYLRRHPRQKERVGRLLQRTGALNRRLQRFAKKHPFASTGRAAMMVVRRPVEAIGDGDATSAVRAPRVPVGPEAGESLRRSLEHARRRWPLGKRIDG